jgi:hypothetical protein
VLQATDDYGKSNVNRCGLEPKVVELSALLIKCLQPRREYGVCC